MDELRAKVRTYIIEQLKKNVKQTTMDLDQIPDDFNLVDSGLIDSLGFLELITPIEIEFGIEFDFTDLDPEDFTVFGRLVDFAAQSAGSIKV